MCVCIGEKLGTLSGGKRQHRTKTLNGMSKQAKRFSIKYEKLLRSRFGVRAKLSRSKRILQMFSNKLPLLIAKAALI